MRPFPLGLLGLLSILPMAPALEAQQAEQLRIAVVVEDPGPDAEFTAPQLEDAVTVLITSKALEVRIASVADLWLYIVPVCLALDPGWSCSFSVSMLIPAGGWSSPFGESPFAAPWLSLWRSHLLLTGPPGNSFPRAREGLDQMLDQPIVGWRRLSDDQWECWLRFLNNNGWDEASWGGAGGSLALALQFGPCD